MEPYICRMHPVSWRRTTFSTPASSSSKNRQVRAPTSTRLDLRTWIMWGRKEMWSTVISGLTERGEPPPAAICPLHSITDGPHKRFHCFCVLQTFLPNLHFLLCGLLVPFFRATGAVGTEDSPDVIYSSVKKQKLFICGFSLQACEQQHSGEGRLLVSRLVHSFCPTGNNLCIRRAKSELTFVFKVHTYL